MSLSREFIAKKIDAEIADRCKGRLDPEEQMAVDRLKKRWADLQAKHASDELKVLLLTEQIDVDYELLEAFVRESM